MSTLTKASFIGLAGVAFSSLTMALSDPAQAAGFVTPYAPANFTTTTNNSNGFVSTSGAPAVIVLSSGNNGTNSAGHLNYVTTAAATGTVSFNWLYSSNGSSAGVSFGYLLNGFYTELAPQTVTGATGSTLFNVAAGNSFGFRINAGNTPIVGTASATITNFNGPTGDPTVVPTPALIPGLIGMGVAAWRKRKAEAEAGVTEEV